MSSLWLFYRFALCRSWASDSLCWVTGLLSSSCVGVRMSHQPRSSCFAPRLQSCCSIAPCILLLSSSFCSLFLKLSLQVYGLFSLYLLCLEIPFMVFHPCPSVLFYGLFPQSYPTRFSTTTEFFNIHIFISWASLWNVFKMHLLFSLKGSFIMYSNPPLIILILFCRLFQIDRIPEDPVVLILLSVVSVDASSHCPQSCVIHNFCFILRSVRWKLSPNN